MPAARDAPAIQRAPAWAPPAGRGVVRDAMADRRPELPDPKLCAGRSLRPCAERDQEGTCFSCATGACPVVMHATCRVVRDIADGATILSKRDRFVLTAG